MEITISCQQNSPGNSYMTNRQCPFSKIVSFLLYLNSPSCEPLPSSCISLSRNPESCHPNLESRTVQFQARLSEFASFATYLRRHIGRSWATCAPSRFKGLFVENAALCFISRIHLSGTWLTFDMEYRDFSSGCHLFPASFESVFLREEVNIVFNNPRFWMWTWGIWALHFLG